MTKTSSAGFVIHDEQLSSEFLPDARPLGDQEPIRVVDALVDMLASVGVDTAFGICGGGIAHMTDALGRSNVSVVHCRHESGAAFAAAEASLASGRPAAVFVTTGPGITNALTGLVAARWEGAKVIFISAATPARLRGRYVFQETGSHTLPEGMFSSGSLFHYAMTVEDEGQLPEIRRRLSQGVARSNGFVAHVCIPVGVQSQALEGFESDASGMPEARDQIYRRRDVEECARLLREHRCALWLGYGARQASIEVRELVEHLQLPVMCSPRGKGILPERHPQYIGVTGLAGHANVKAALKEYEPEYTLVLGSRLGEFTSMWDPSYAPSKSFIHVDLDPEVVGMAYSSVPTMGVQAEIGCFLQALLDEVRAHAPRTAPLRPIPAYASPPPLTPRTRGMVRPRALMEAIQRKVVDESEAIVISEAGNSFAWANHSLLFARPGRYRTSMAWGSMGHAVTGVIGAGLHHADKAVAIAGDGAMLMNSEISTAVQYGVPALWIVLNDSQYGMIEHGMRGLGYSPVETDIPAGTDFVQLARAMGADGIRVESEEDLDAALAQAMAAEGPFVVDVLVDPDEPAPVGQQRATLRAGKPAPVEEVVDEGDDGLD